MSEPTRVGDTRERLTVVMAGLRIRASAADAKNSGRQTHAAVLVTCDCGNSALIRDSQFRSGRTRSCGCLQREHVSTLGKLSALPAEVAAHPRYATYSGIMKRCYDPNNAYYPRYGGRGITIADEWNGNPEAFLAYLDAVLGVRPDRCTLDRIDNDGNYEPGNIRWATAGEQARNRSPRPPTRLDENPDEELLRGSDAAALLGVPSNKILARWAAAGHIPFCLTPGGHRRYRRYDVEALRRQFERAGRTTVPLTDPTDSPERPRDRFA